MFFNWRRPSTTNYHYNVYSFFTAQNAEQFVIKNLSTADAKEQALNLIMQELQRDDQIISALEFDPVSEKNLRNRLALYLEQNVALGCYTNKEGTLVAVDNLYVRNIRDTFPELTEDSGQAFRSFIKYTKLIEIRIWNLNQLKVCNYLTSSGVFILPAYRNIGIINQMIRKRVSAASSLRIEVIGSAFIGNEMQQAAKKYKYRVLETFRQPQDMVDLGLDFNYGQIFPIEISIKIHKIKREEEKNYQAANE